MTPAHTPTPDSSAPRLVLAAGSMLDQAPEALLEAAAAAGFDGVGLRLSAEHATTHPVALGERARRLGLSIHDVEVHRIRRAAPEPAPLIEAAIEVGATALLVVSDTPDRDETRRALTDLVERAAPHNLRIGLEYMAWTDPDNPADAVALAAETGCAVVVDLLHHVRVGAGAAEVDAVVASGTLGWVQICDAPAARPSGTDALVDEARHGRLPPGAGELPLPELLARLPEGVTYSVEVQSDALLARPAEERARLLAEASRAVLALGHSPSSTG